ncbi:HpaII family restriction endonuclease [Sulfurospirillum barnesii]|uniref:HpaII restriction endonuclease n=1 Tax=Sulfurospirillum barnesii (strain ATCC 700032 / DSM 10660 / SES-3) TaxID=760154 RepID=I3XYQ8_SULBS|nr:HpaII family restriction endonuclease [Sulfurospirillum barnesii]AFL69082.1 HpaII restriction endonuclease [Sulfurospirillum barnesii SES-3]
MGFNKGEWSELYTFLYLLENSNLVIVDENLQVINNKLFKILEIILADKKYEIQPNQIIKLCNNREGKNYTISDLSKQSKILLSKIVAHKSANGSFEIDEISSFINDFFDGKKPKGASNVKGDLEANVADNRLNVCVNLKYNIKSSLGASATLLNASNHTNFIYELTNINDNIMDANNAIHTHNKLLDRCIFLNQNNVTINFVKVESTTLDYNLKLVDSNLGIFLAEMLYLSYLKNEKNIKKLINFISKNQDEYSFYEKKVGDFANAVTFGMRASEKWNGTNEVNGGIILVTKTGDVYLLDLIYFKNCVDKYLIDNIKLDSPSSSHYGMFDIYKENGRYFFKLNLQIRFK